MSDDTDDRVQALIGKLVQEVAAETVVPLPGFTALSLVPVPIELDGVTIELQLASGFVVQGWMTRRFRGSPRSYFTWDPAFVGSTLEGNPRAAAVVPVAWRACDAAIAVARDAA
jgi:hypothetical protein